MTILLRSLNKAQAKEVMDMMSEDLRESATITGNVIQFFARA